MIERPGKKKKIDYEALGSAFMRISNIDVATARDLIDLGYREAYELIGLSADFLYEELMKVRSSLPKDRMKKLKIVVYYAENPNASASELDAAGDL